MQLRSLAREILSSCLRKAEKRSSEISFLQHPFTSDSINTITPVNVYDIACSVNRMAHYVPSDDHVKVMLEGVNDQVTNTE